MSTRPSPADSQLWLMQPRWVPALRAGIGGVVSVCAIAALALVWPWDGADLLLTLWLGLGIFLMWASRFEHSGTRIDPDAVSVAVGRRVRRFTRAEILDLRHDRPGEAAWRVQAVLRDGETVTLLGVPPSELGRFRAWHQRRTD